MASLNRWKIWCTISVSIALYVHVLGYEISMSDMSSTGWIVVKVCPMNKCVVIVYVIDYVRKC